MGRWFMKKLKTNISTLLVQKGTVPFSSTIATMLCMVSRWCPRKLGQSLLLLLVFTTVFLSAGAAISQDKAVPLPKFEKIEAAVWRYFQSQPNFQTSSLITREQVEPVVAGIARMGFTLPDAKSILDKVPAGNEFLVAELHSPAGRKFMVAHCHISRRL